MNEETIYETIIEELPKCDVISVTSEPVGETTWFNTVIVFENKENRYTVEITTGWHWKSFRSYKTIRFRKLTVEIADNVVFVFERPYVGKPASSGMVYYDPMDVARIVSRLSDICYSNIREAFYIMEKKEEEKLKNLLKILKSS
jgi:hypothetical protein